MLPVAMMYIGKDDDGNTVDLGVTETRKLLESIPNSIVQALNYSNVSGHSLFLVGRWAT